MIKFYLKEVFSVEQEELCQEMAAVMKQLSPGRQRQLLELALAFKRAESCLGPSPPDEEEI